MDEATPSAPALTAVALTELLREQFSEVFQAGGSPVIENVRHGGARIRMPFQSHTLRPGGTISGPTMMALTDVTLYVAVLASIGWVPLAVTTQISINFLRKPEPADLIAEGRLVKLGKRLAVGEVSIRSEGREELVAHATGTYSIPEKR
jgi:uncharacterized protein (TIGR00369 family)